MDGLETLGALLAHEEEELRRRAAIEQDKAGRIAMLHKALMAALVRDWIADLQAGRRPGCGGYSRGANHFHVNGELLAAFCESECLAGMAVKYASNGVADTKVCAVD